MEFNPAEQNQEVIVNADFDNFAQVPFGIAEKKRVSGGAVKLYIIYFKYAFNWRGQGDKNVKRVSQKIIADDLRYSTTYVSTLTSELHNEGWLTRKRTGRTNIITLHNKRKRRKK